MSSMQEFDSPVSVFNDTSPSDSIWTDAHMGDQYDNPLNLWPTSSFTEAYDPSHDWFLNSHREMRDAPMESGDYDEREAQTMSGIATEGDQIDQAATTEGTVVKTEEQEDRATAPGTNKILLPKKRPTRFASNQTLMITLKRAYKDADRYLLAVPHGSAATVVQADQTSANGTHIFTATPSYSGHPASGQTVPMGLHVDMPMLSKHEPIYQLGWGAEHYATMSCVGPAEYQQQNDLSQNFATTFSGANVVVSTPKRAGDDTKRHRRRTTIAEFDHDFMRQLQHDGTAEVPHTPTKQNTLAATLAAARTPGKPSQVTWSLPANHRDRSDEPMSPLSPVPRRDWQYSQLLERRRGPTAAPSRHFDRNEWVPNVHGSLLEQNFGLNDDGEEPERDAFSHYGVGSYTGDNPI